LRASPCLALHGNRGIGLHGEYSVWLWLRLRLEAPVQLLIVSAYRLREAQLQFTLTAQLSSASALKEAGKN
jgi:hypothetical protein